MSDAVPFELTDPAIRKLLVRAKRLGFVTVGELSGALPQNQVTSEQIENILSAIDDMGVQIVENEQEYTDKDEFERRRVTFRACMTELRAVEAQRWGILTREEVDKAQRHYGLYTQQIREVQDSLVRSNTMIVAESDLAKDGMPRPGVLPRRSYDDRIAQAAPNDPRQLEISLDEIEQFGPRSEFALQKLGIMNPNALLKLGDLAEAESFDALFWVAGMQSTVSSLAMKRLTGFVTDVSLELACGLKLLGEDDTQFLRSWRASQDYVLRWPEVQSYIREARVGQQAWLRHSGKMPIGADFPWIAHNGNSGPHLASSQFDGWREWAECMAWYVDEARALYGIDWDQEGSQERNEGAESELQELLIRWFDPSPPPAFQTIEDRCATFAGSVVRRDPLTVTSASPFWTTVSIFPETVRRIERLDVDGRTNGAALPYSLESIGVLSLYRQAGSFNIPTGVKEIDKVDVDECSLYLPATIKRVGELELHIVEPNCYRALGVERYDLVDLALSDCAFQEGLLEIGTLKADCSDVALPSSLKEIESLIFEDTLFDPEIDASDRKPSSLTWKEGATRLGSLTLGETYMLHFSRS